MIETRVNVGMSYDDYYLMARTLIYNSLDNEEIVVRMNDAGYPKERLEEGKKLYDESFALKVKQDDSKGVSSEASKEFKEAFKRADDYFAQLIKFARIALEDDIPSLEKLAIKCQRKKNISGWISQAETFYSNALSNPILQAKLSDCGITEKKLLEGQSLAKVVIKMHGIKEEKDGRAQMATSKKEQALRELKKWVKKYRKTARLALAAEPQLMEIIGIKEE